MDKMDGMTMDIEKANIDKLKEMFPEVVSEGRVDFDKLQSLLGNYIADDKEKYSFSWKGKADSIRLAQKRSTGTLRPCKEESKNWDTTQNLYIEGDNLEVLKLLQSSYLNSIKMIYIDPPYNTGNDFVYNDSFADPIAQYKEVTGQATRSNPETAGRYHTNWLNMMYPRLKLARNLLTDDGVIFISIDDNEQANLKKLCDEVFGEDNIEVIVWKKKGGASNTEKIIGTLTEFIICCFKKKTAGVLNYKKLERTYKYQDEKGFYNLEGIEKTNLGAYERTTMQFPIVDPKTKQEFYPSENMRWTLGYETVIELLKEGKLYFDYANNRVKRIKRQEDYDNTQNVFYNLLVDEGSLASAKDECERLLGNREIFDTPKPVQLLTTLLKMSSKNDSIILDFFSGSATTAHAVMQLNAEDGGNRKFICVQLPEKTDEKSEAYKAGYKNICGIGEERIRRAGAKILEEKAHLLNAVKSGKFQKGEAYAEFTSSKQAEKAQQEVANTLDIGFKVFKLDSSNLVKWDNTPTDSIEEVEKRIQNSIFYLVDGRQDIDLVYEIMLKYGLSLTLPVEEKVFDGVTSYIITHPQFKVLVCLQPNITLSAVEEMDKEVIGTYIFADRCFANANILSNTQEILKKSEKKMELF